MRGEAALVKALCKPLSPRPVEGFEEALQEIEGAGLVLRYMVGRQTYLQIGKWEEYQGASGIHKRTKSDFPAAPNCSAEPSGNLPGTFREGVGNIPPRALTGPDPTKPDAGEGPGEPSGGGSLEPCRPASPTAVAAPPPAAVVEPVGQPEEHGTPPPIAPPPPADPLLAAMERLRRLPRYAAAVDDLPWLGDAARDFPDVDIHVEIASCAAWWAAKDTVGSKRPNWRLRLRNWAKNAQQRAGLRLVQPRASPPRPLGLAEQIMADAARGG